MDEKQLAEEHWKFLEKWLHMIFVDAFIHGFGHGYEKSQNEGRLDDDSKRETTE